MGPSKHMRFLGPSKHMRFQEGKGPSKNMRFLGPPKHMSLVDSNITLAYKQKGGPPLGTTSLEYTVYDFTKHCKL